MTVIDEPINEAIARLRHQHTDDADYEAKSCSIKLSKSVWDSVSAFANTNGGKILLGIDEEAGFTVPKNFDIQAVLNQFIEGIGDGGEVGAKVTPMPHHQIDRESVDGEQILVIQIDENAPDDKPCYVKSQGITRGSYKRCDDKDIRLSPTELYELEHIHTVSAADTEIVENADRSDLDPELIQNLLRQQQYSRKFRGTSSDEERLIRLNIISKKKQVLLAGMLTSGIYPQQYFPKLLVDVAVHPGITKSEPGMPRFLDRQLCDGTVFEMIDAAVAAVLRNLRTYSLIEGTGRKDIPEIPSGVLREAITNAIVHREYHPYFRGESVSVDIYPDRVEITSPGGLWGGKTLENIDNGKSVCRNAILMQLMEIAMLPHNEGAAAEGQGSGIPLMIHEMEAHALKKPEFKATADSFTVVLYRAGTELAANQQWIRSLGVPISSQETSILLTIRELGEAHVRDIHTQLGYDSDDIRDILNHLEKMGIIQRTATDVYSVLEREAQAIIAQQNDAEVSNQETSEYSTAEAIIQAMPKHEGISARELAEKIGKSATTVRHVVSDLVRQGTLVAIGKSHSRMRKYAFPDITNKQDEM